MSDHDNILAIVGLSGRFPGARDVESFWDNLCQGRETIAQLEESEGLVPARGIVDDIDQFDSDFFDIGPGEAEAIDPQQRLFLECSWEALESAGYDPSSYSGRIGVYGGTGDNTYLVHNILPNVEKASEKGDYLLALGNRPDFLTTRVSYKLNLRGPSLAVQTACSSSLVAVCLACNDLLTYQADMAIAGGMSLVVPQEKGYRYQEGMIYSPDGKCRPFDASANGTVASNGGGAVLIKRLSDAIEDGDTIYATINGYATNNDGQAKVGYSAPSIQGQVDVIRSSLDMAGFDPASIGYVEAHGTGTPLGDPIEIAALTEAFEGKGSAAIGSVKGNIGHLLESAGIAGLIKAAMILHTHQIPPSLHFSQANPHIDFASSPFTVNTTLKEWKKGDDPRRATVSSFGIGGTNAHLSLQEWRAPVQTLSQGSELILLSAKSETALEKMKRRLAQYVQEHPDLSLANLAYTLQVGRERFDHRAHFIASSLEELTAQLKGESPSRADEPLLALYQRWEGGETLEWPSEGKRRIPLPTYPFERKRFWIDPPADNPVERHEHKATQVAVDEIYQQLTEIYRDILGVQTITRDDDFFDLGGDSLDVIRLSSAIERAFGVKVPIQTLSEHMEVGSLANHIYERSRSGSEVLKEGIVELRKGRGERALLFLHPVEGQLLCYRELVDQLDFEGAIYGIYASDETEPRSIEAMARRYIELVKEKGIERVSLIGMSFGGVLAYEVAHQLRLGSVEVEALILMDAFRPDIDKVQFEGEGELIMAFTELFERQPLPGNYIESTTLDEKRERLVKSLNMGNLSADQQRLVFEKVLNHARAAMEFEPMPYYGDILYLEVRERFIREKDHSLGEDWRPLVKGQYDLVLVPGNHQSFLKEPHVRVVAHEVNRHLSRPRVPAGR